MRLTLSLRMAALILLAGMATGCDKLGIGNKIAEPAETPTEQELAKISYMTSANTGVNGRKLYIHPEEAKTCGDFELAMRWNRPPNVEGGTFRKKMVYLTAGMPADLPKSSEVFIRAKIEKGMTMPSGAAGWSLRMKDGTVVQAIESANFWEKEEQAAQDSGNKGAVVSPTVPGRAFCAHGIYEGITGKASEQDTKIPLFSLLFAMDRDK
jgi:hypothetical protein